MAQCKPKALHLDEVPPKDMKKKRKKRKGKKKQNLCFGKLEECSSGKGILDLKEAYKEKPVQEEIPARKGEEQPAEDTTEIQQEEASEDVQSEDDAWENKEESWSPEIEGVSDPRPDGTRLTYERDFLLQLQTNPICMQKPEGLPDLEIILVQARTPSKPGFQQNINACRMPKGDGGENMFLPAYIRQGSKCLPSQPFLHSQRPVRIRGPPPPNNQPVDTCLPGAPVVQMIGYPGPTQFLAPRKPGPFIPQHVDFQLPMGGPPQYRPPQAMQGQSPLVSGPSQPNGPFVYQQSSGYPIGQPPPPVYIVRAPATPLQGMQQFQPQFEPRPRERKIFQIKDPISNKDVTQEILKRQPASSLTSTAVGTPNNTPNLSGQSSSSGIPPLTSQQQAEANVRAQFAAQVAATLVNSEDRPKKPEYTIQKSTVNNRADVDIVKAKETLNVQKEEGLKSARKNDTVSNVMETVQETQMKEGTVPVKSQTKEAVRGVKLCEGSSSESLLGSKSLVSSVDATTLRNKKISNVRVEIFTKELLYKGSRKSNAVKTDEEVNFSKVHVAPKDIKEERKKQRLKEMEKQSSEKAMDLIEAYTEKPVQGERKMASESLECSICCEKFDDQQHCPRLLPSCGHSFCTSCLQSLLKKNTINCPTCRSTVSAPAGLATLPKNFALLDILLSLPQKENDDLQLCQICDDEKHPAISCCLDCKEYMCKDAARLHTRQKMARDHCVVSLDELKANPKLAAASDVFCPEHNDQFRFFDEDCGHVVCRDCVTLKHHGHKCLSLADAASKYRQEMDELSNKAIDLAEKVKAGEACLKEATDDLKQEYANTAVLIKSTFKELHEALTARETVLMSELDNLYNTKEITLTEQRDRLCLFQACLDSGIQRAKTAVQSSGNVELLVARTDIVSTLGPLDSQPPVLDPQTNGILDFSVDVKKLLDVLRETGSVSDNYACAANTSASDFGLSWVKSGEDVVSFTITVRDSKGHACGLRGNIFEAKLKKGNEEKTVMVNLTENAFGSCTASYAVPADAKGQYLLSVLLRGDHIKGSPFTVYLDVPVGKMRLL